MPGLSTDPTSHWLPDAPATRARQRVPSSVRWPFGPRTHRCANPPVSRRLHAGRARQAPATTGDPISRSRLDSELEVPAEDQRRGKGALPEGGWTIETASAVTHRGRDHPLVFHP